MKAPSNVSVMNSISDKNKNFMSKLFEFYTYIYFISECDRACEGCTGDGPDLCDKCAEGYELRDGMCTGIIQNQLQF